MFSKNYFYLFVKWDILYSTFNNDQKFKMFKNVCMVKK